MLLHTNFELLEKKAEVLKNMGHPIRLSIIELLSQHEKLTVTEIYTELSIEQAVASHHLRILKNSGILQSQKDGKKAYYSIKSPHIKTIFSLLIAF